MTDFWYIVTMLTFCYLVLILPAGMFYSDTDEENPTKERVLGVVKKQAALVVVAVILMFVPFAFIRYTYIPITARTCEVKVGDFMPASQEVNIDSSGCTSLDTTLKVDVPFPVYGICVMTVIGWILLIFFLPVGMWAFCFDNIFAFVN